MTLQQLKYIDAVAKTGNISKAAGRLFVSQPSLTAAVQAVEKEMKISIFTRTNKGVTVTRQGEEFLAYARQILEQAQLMEEKFSGVAGRNVRFSVSCQHYSFAVNAFVDVIKEYDSAQYDFTLRETQTHEIIEDVSLGKSEIGILYLSDKNKEVIEKLLRRNGLTFETLLTAGAHIFISKSHPLAKKDMINPAELEGYPYLSFEQGEHNSFYFSEEIMTTLDSQKNIKVRDRATLFNLLIGLDGYTVSSGIIDAHLNGESIISKPLNVPEQMEIGVITKKNTALSRYALSYMQALKRHTKSK